MCARSHASGPGMLWEPQAFVTCGSPYVVVPVPKALAFHTGGSYFRVHVICVTQITWTHETGRVLACLKGVMPDAPSPGANVRSAARLVIPSCAIRRPHAGP